MAITYGFFNSVSGDRTYDADQMSEYFEGLISNGVYEDIDGALQVVAGTDMSVNVQPGRAVINCKWFDSSAVESLSITQAHVTLNRYTRVVVHLDLSERTITLITIDGTPASSPVVPALTNNETIMEICLATIYVGAGVTSITQANITDTRADSTICGWVTGLIEQVDTSTLFAQWQAAYQAYYTSMTTQFNTWLESLTSKLNVNTYIQEYKKTLEMDDSSSGIVDLDWSGYTYEDTDIFIISINGLLATEVYDYLLDTSVSPVQVHLNLTNTTEEVVSIRVLKSKIGFDTLVTSDSSTVVTDDSEAIIV